MDPLTTARKVLDEVGDMTYQNRSLNDVIADLKDRVKIAITLIVIAPTQRRFMRQVRSSNWLSPGSPTC